MIIKIINIVVFGVLMASCSFSSNFDGESVAQFADQQIVAVAIADQQLEVEVVTTPEGTAQGLSGRSEIGQDGMLFVFSEPKERSFWMKDMQFAIDIIWIRRGRVIGIERNVPPPEIGSTGSELPLYFSKKPVDMVLEVPAGNAAERGIEIGNAVVIKQ